MILKNPVIEASLSSYTGWKLHEKGISKEFVFTDFIGAIKFVDQVASIAQEQNHHPDIDIRYNKVFLLLSTHDEGGVTQKDIDLVEPIEKLLA